MALFNIRNQKSHVGGILNQEKLVNESLGEN